MDDTSQVGPETAGQSRVFELGDIAIQVISDGDVPYPTDFVYANAPLDELDAGLAGRLGSLVDGDALTFPDARHVIEAREWDCWTDENQLARLPDLLTHPARAVLPVLAEADVVDRVQGETEIVPGVRLIPAPGHTVGHCVVSIDSGSQRVIFLADALLDRLQLVHPDWLSQVDMLPEETVATRIRLLDEASHQGSLVLAYHVVGAGHIERRDGGYLLTAA